MPILNWISIGGGAVVAFALSWLLHTVDVDRIESNHRNEMAQQERLLVNRCNDEKKTTKEANDALQSQLSIIGKRLAASKLQPTKCMPISSSVAEHTAGGGEHAGSNGLSTDWLYSFAAECETYRSEVIVLDDFGKKNCQ